MRAMTRAQLWAHRRAHRAPLARPETRRRQHCALTMAHSTVDRAGGRGQDHLDARPARRETPLLRQHAGVGADRQGGRRRGARRRRRPGLHHRQSTTNCCPTTNYLSARAPWSWSMRPPWSAPPTYATCSTATTAAGAKTVLVADHHQLAPVKARGGHVRPPVFGPALDPTPLAGVADARSRRTPRHPSRCALADRHRCAARWSGTAPMTGCTAGMRSRWPPTLWPPTKPTPTAGKDALLVCDTTEMANALNQRIHHQRVAEDSPSAIGGAGTASRWAI